MFIHCVIIEHLLAGSNMTVYLAGSHMTVLINRIAVITYLKKIVEVC